jgi:hypothetical protein
MADFFVSRFAAVTDFFDRTIEQFPKWRHFVSDAEKDPLTCEEAAEIPVLAHVMVAALRESEARNFIDPAIPSALEVFQAPLLFQAPSQSESLRQEEQFGRPGEASKLLLANDLFASIDNVAKRTAEAALEIKTFGEPNGETGFKNEAFSSAGESLYLDDTNLVEIGSWQPGAGTPFKILLAKAKPMSRRFLIFP